MERSIFILLIFLSITCCEKDYKELAKWDDTRQEWYYGKYENYTPVGKWYTWYPNKKIKSISENPNGYFYSWYENGNKRVEATYKGGYLIGEKKEWFENGNLKRVEKWDEKKHLVYWKELHENGNIRKEAKEENNFISGDLWYNNGNKQQQGIYVNPKAQKTGPWIFWYENGKKSVEGPYRNDVHIGKHIDYDNDGKIRAILFYDDKGELLKIEKK